MAKSTQPYRIVKAGGKKSLVISSEFKAALMLLVDPAEQEKLASNLVEIFDQYKQLTGNGLPGFVHEFLDPTCPAAYGNPGSDIRRAITTHKVFNKIEYIVKEGRKARKTSVVPTPSKR